MVTLKTKADKAFIERYQEMVDAAGGQTASAKIANVGRGSIFNHYNGKTKPSFQDAAALATYTKFSLDWLAGRKASKMVKTKVVEPDFEILQDVIINLETVLKTLGVDLEPEEKSKWIPLLYRYHAAVSSEADRMDFIKKLMGTA